MGSTGFERNTFNKLHGVSNVHALQTRAKQNLYYVWPMVKDIALNSKHNVSSSNLCSLEF
jgi:hypothetical protein